MKNIAQGIPKMLFWIVMILTGMASVRVPAHATGTGVTENAAGNDRQPLPVFILAGHNNVAGYHHSLDELPEEYKDGVENALFYKEGNWVKLSPEATKTEDTQSAFGLETSFASRLSEEFDDKTGIIRVYKGNTSVADDWDPENGELYKKLVETIQSAKKSRSLNILGLVWDNGLGDAKTEEMAKAYKANFEHFIYELRKDIDEPGLPVISVREPISKELIKIQREQLEKVELENHAWVNSDDIPQPDKWHYTAEGTIMLGRRLAEKMLRFIPEKFTGQTNAVRAGALHIEPPTLICLGFDWRIEGDDNVNAEVQVQYRRHGESRWKQYMPLLRTGRGRTAGYGYGNFNDPHHEMEYRIPDGFAGSIMDLQPGTVYEVRLEMTDPDGVSGEPVRKLTLETRAEPQPFAGGEVRHVYPPGYEGEKEQPAYNTLMHAVNGFQTWCDCYQTVHPNRARPGTRILVHGGVHKTDYHDYRDEGGLWLHGMQTFIAGGEPGKPIAIMAAGDGEVIFDANGSDRYFNIAAADHLYFEGITVRNTRIAFYCGLQGLQACTGLTVKNCRIEQVQYGVLAQDGRSENFYIADNVFTGRNPSDRFNPESGGAWGHTEAGYPVNLAGKGHVVCYNHAANFWDGFNVFTNSLADPGLNQQSRAIDIYNNDIYNITDNFIEADGGYANIRILRNRCFNSMAAPLSIQPVYCGPVYWIRNIVYNSHKGTQAFKMVNGDNVIIYHNTSTCHYTVGGGVKYMDMRNNLFMGPADYVVEKQRERGMKIFSVGFDDERSRVDYNAVRVGIDDEDIFCMKSGQTNVCAGTTEEFAEKTGYQEHTVEVKDYDIFVDAREPDHVPSNEGKLYNPRTVDLRPKPRAPVVDAGCIIPGINDNYTGKAPDIGTYEAGQERPHYGPRKR